MILWYLTQYYYYASCILVISISMVVWQTWEVQSNIRRLSDMAFYELPVQVFRKGMWMSLISSDLIPGDVIEVPERASMPCDAILLEGSAVVSEAMLTGESVPVIKAPLPSLDERYNIE